MRILLCFEVCDTPLPFKPLLTTSLQTETPNTHLSKTFHCTPDIEGRLTPYPSYVGFYVLDFIDNDGRRLNEVPIDVRDLGVVGLGGTNNFNHDFPLAQLTSIS